MIPSHTAKSIPPTAERRPGTSCVTRASALLANFIVHVSVVPMVSQLAHEVIRTFVLRPVLLGCLSRPRHQNAPAPMKWCRRSSHLVEREGRNRQSLLFPRAALPVVGLEWRGGQACAVHEVRIGGLAPAETHLRGRVDALGRHEQSLALDNRLGGNELAVLAGDLKFAEWLAVAGFQAVGGVCEAQANLPAFDLHRLVKRAGIYD